MNANSFDSACLGWPVDEAIAERLRLGGAHRTSGGCHKLALKASGIGLWELDVRTEQIVLSDTMNLLLGRGDGNLVETNAAFLEHVHNGDRHWFAAKMQQARRSAEGFAAWFRVLWPDGTERWLEARVGAMQRRDGTLTRLLGVSWDITEPKRVEEERARRRSDMEAQNQRLRQAMGETHHRVKNNLQIIAGMINLCVTSSVGTVTVDQVQRLGNQIRTLATVHDLLTQNTQHDLLTQNTQQDGQTQYVSVRALLTQLLPLLDRVAGEGRIRFHLQDAPVTARQGNALALAAHELVNNALKHSSGEVSVRFEPRDRIGTLEICDRGPGFVPEFTLAKSAHTGLTLVQQLISWDLGGHMRFENRLEGGARVVVEFPLG